MTNNQNISWLSNAIKFLVYSNVWVAINVCCFTAVTFLVLDVQFNIPYLSFSFFSTLLAYNFQRLIKFSKQDTYSERSEWLNKHQFLLYVLSAFGLLGSIISLFYLPFSILKFFLLPGLLSVFYVIPINKKKQSLRDLPYIKIYLIAFSWVFVTVIIPAFISGEEFSSIWLLVFQQLLFIIAITIPFDIRDMKIDNPIKRTVPQIFGLNNSLRLSLVVLFFSLIFAFTSYNNEVFSWPVFLAFLVSTSVAAFIISKTNINRNEMFYTGVLDGLFFVEFIVVLSFISYNVY